MDKAYIVYIILLTVVLQFKGTQASCKSVDYPATYTWPLGEGINQYEISTKSWAGNINNVTYKSGPSYLNYNATELNGIDGSFIEVPVLFSNGIVNDYAISFYLFVVGDGVFLHYRSDNYADNATSGSLKSVKMAVLGGKIQTTIGNGLGETMDNTSISIAYNKWNRVIFQRDSSQYKITYRLDSSGSPNDQEAVFSQWIENLPMSYPGTLRFGGSLDGDSFVTGRVTCAQFIPCKDVDWDGGYENTCLTANWPDLASTTTTTTNPTTSPVTTFTTTPSTTFTTSPATTTTTITTTNPTTSPATTSTTTPTTTLTTTPTTTFTTTPTTTTTNTPTTTSTTTPTTTTTTTHTTTSTTTPATTSTTLSTTSFTTTPTTTTTTTPTITTTTIPTTSTTTYFTTTPTTTPTTTTTSNLSPTAATTTTTSTTYTTTRTSSTTTASTTVPTTSSTFTSCSPPQSISLNCIRYRVAHLNATLSSGILGDFAVDAPLACSSKCSKHGACRSFAFKSGNCMLGSSSPGTVYDAGSIVYELA